MNRIITILYFFTFISNLFSQTYRDTNLPQSELLREFGALTENFIAITEEIKTFGGNLDSSNIITDQEEILLIIGNTDLFKYSMSYLANIYLIIEMYWVAPENFKRSNKGRIIATLEGARIEVSLSKKIIHKVRTYFRTKHQISITVTLSESIELLNRAQSLLKEIREYFENGLWD